jgi:low affinity Fe/Cu permease
MNEMFSKFATAVARQSGRPTVFALAWALLLLWAASGPFVGFSENWQLIINTATTIITFLMVFLIQNTQNRDSLAVQIKLDELIRAMEGARDDFIDLEQLSEKQLDTLREKLGHLGEQARAHGIAEIADATSHVEKVASELHETVGRVVGRRRGRSK